MLDKQRMATSCSNADTTRAHYSKMVRDAAAAAVKLEHTAVHKVDQATKDKPGCKCVIDPRKRWFQVWETITAVCLVIICFSVPFQVAFVNKEDCDYTIYPETVFNRILDGIFVIDMCFQFFVMYRRFDPVRGPIWVRSNRRIFAHYFCTWFLVDLVSNASTAFEVSGFSCTLEREAATGNTNVAGLGRLMRLLRLTRLIRLVRGSRAIIKVKAQLGLSTATEAVLEISAIIVIFLHWISCAVAIQVQLYADSPLDSWLGRYGYCWPNDRVLYGMGGPYEVNGYVNEHQGPWRPLFQWWRRGYIWNYPTTPGKQWEPYQCVPIGYLYLRCLHWGVLLITNIDYLPAVGPREPFCAKWRADECRAELENAEIVTMCIILVFCAMLWAYITARFVDVVTNADPDDTEYRNRMDDLNTFMRKNAITNENAPGGGRGLRSRLREYLANSRHLQTAAQEQRVQRLLSPDLRSEVIFAVHSRWIERVPFFGPAETDFLVRIIGSLDARLFPVAEIITTHCVYIIQAGIVLCAGKILTKDRVFGLDALLTSRFMPRPTARAVSYIEALCIWPDVVHELGLYYPRARHAMVRFIAFRALHQFLMANYREAKRLARESLRERRRQTMGITHAGRALGRESTWKGAFEADNTGQDTGSVADSLRRNLPTAVRENSVAPRPLKGIMARSRVRARETMGNLKRGGTLRNMPSSRPLSSAKSATKNATKSLTRGISAPRLALSGGSSSPTSSTGLNTPASAKSPTSPSIGSIGWGKLKKCSKEMKASDLRLKENEFKGLLIPLGLAATKKHKPPPPDAAPKALSVEGGGGGFGALVEGAQLRAEVSELTKLMKESTASMREETGALATLVQHSIEAMKDETKSLATLAWRTAVDVQQLRDAISEIHPEANLDGHEAATNPSSRMPVRQTSSFGRSGSSSGRRHRSPSSRSSSELSSSRKGNGAGAALAPLQPPTAHELGAVAVKLNKGKVQQQERRDDVRLNPPRQPSPPADAPKANGHKANGVTNGTEAKPAVEKSFSAKSAMSTIFSGSPRT